MRICLRPLSLLTLLVALPIACSGARTASATTVAPASPSAAVEAELRRNTQALLDAIAPGDTAVWNHFLDPDVIIVDEADVLHDKKDMLAILKPLPPGLIGHLKIDDFHMRMHGDVAVVTHEDDEYLDYHGQILLSRFRNTDTWLHGPTGWKEIGSQVLAVHKDPPSIHLAAALLCTYNGRYEMTKEIVTTIQCSGDSLLVRRDGHPDRGFLAEARDVFFERGAPRTRRIFVYDADGHVSGFVDRREERDIAWKRTGAITS